MQETPGYTEICTYVKRNIAVFFEEENINTMTIVGVASYLGYDYDPIDKSISINQAESDIVRYIFDRYIEGDGGYVITKELTKLGYKTKYGNSQWHDTGVLGIIKNEKYKVDVLQGKTLTVDPISKSTSNNK